MHKQAGKRKQLSKAEQLPRRNRWKRNFCAGAGLALINSVNYFIFLRFGVQLFGSKTFSAELNLSSIFHFILGENLQAFIVWIEL